MNKRANPFDFIFLTRPILFIPVWTLFLAGAYWARVEKGDSFGLVVQFLPDFRTFLSLFSYTILMGGVYIVNQLQDVETDRANRKLFLISEGYVSKRAAIVEIVLLFIFSFGFVLLFSWSLRIFFLLSLILGLLYSVSPFSFKGRPFLDLFSNGAGYGSLAFMVGWLSLSNFSFEALLRSIPYALAVGGVFLNTTVPDIEGDKNARKITTGVFLGLKGTVWLAFGLVSFAFITSFLLNDWVCILASGFSILFFLWAGLVRSMKSIMVSYQLGGAGLVIIIGFFHLWFFVLLAVTFLGLKAYYRFRFGMKYPALADRG